MQMGLLEGTESGYGISELIMGSRAGTLNWHGVPHGADRRDMIVNTGLAQAQC